MELTMEAQRKVNEMIEFFEKLAVSQLHLRVAQEPRLRRLAESEVIPSMPRIRAADKDLREAAEGIDSLGLPREVLDQDVTTAGPEEGDPSPPAEAELGDVEVVIDGNGILVSEVEIFDGKSSRTPDPSVPRLVFITGEESAVLVGDTIDARLRDIFEKHSWKNPKWGLDIQLFNRNIFARRAARALRLAVQEMFRESKDEDQDGGAEEVMLSMSTIRWGCARGEGEEGAPQKD